MKLVSRLLVCLILFSSIHMLAAGKPGAASPDPDPDFGFEDVAEGKPAKWTLLGVEEDDYQSVTTPVFSGAYSVKLDDLSNQTSIGLRSVKLPVTSGTDYRAAVMSYNLAGESELYLEFWNSADERIDVLTDMNQALNEWTEISLAGKAPEEATYATLLIYMHIANEGTAYFDEASFESLDPNFGFEDLTGGKPAKWTLLGNEDDDYQSVTTPVYGGTHSVKLDDLSNQTSIGLRSVKLPVTPGTDYRASVMSYNLTGESELYLEFWNSADERIDVLTGMNQALNEWTKISLAGMAPEEATYATLLIYMHIANEGTAYFDEASFESLGPNLDFEDVEGGKPAKWTLYGSMANQIQSVTDIVYAGDYSVRIDDPSSESSIGLRSVSMPIVPGSDYQATIMSFNLAGESELYLEFWNAANERIGVVSAANKALNEWKAISVKGTAMQGAAYATLLLYLHGVNTGTSYFDRATFAALPPEPVREFPLLVSGHPRLYFTQEDIPGIQGTSADTVHLSFGQTGAGIWNQLEQVANDYLSETSFSIGYYGGYRVTYALPPLEPDPIPDPPGFEGGRYPYWSAMAKGIEERLKNLSLAYVVTEDQDFADKAKDYLMAMTTWSTWTDPTYECGASCLDTAHITIGVSMAYDVLYDQLTANERTQVVNALATKGLLPLYIDVWESDHNTTLLKAAALGIGALAVLGELPDASKYLTRAANYYAWYLDARLNSGVQEGLHYTAYSIENLIGSIDTISRVTGINELINHPFIDDFVVRWSNYFLAPGGGGLANFSDAETAHYFKLTMTVINNLLHNGYAGWYLDETKARTDLFTEFLYFNPQPIVTMPTTWAPSAVLDEIGWAALRSGWGNGDTLLAFVSNNSTLGHNHYDQNSFQIATNRAWIAGDPGYQDFSPGAIHDFTVKMGHSTIQVDGQGQSYLGNGSLTKGMLAPGYDYIKGSAAGAYVNPKLTKFDRHIVYVKPDYFVMFDDLQSDIPRVFDWTLYSGGYTTFEIDGQPGVSGQTMQGNDLFISSMDAALTAKFLSPGTVPITVGKYAGAEDYGNLTKVSSGAPSTEHQYVTVLKAEPIMGSGFKAKDLPIADSSGKESKVVATMGTNLVFYRGEAIGDYLTLSFEVSQSGTYDLSMFFIQTTGYGQVQTYIDGQPVGGVFDGFHVRDRVAEPFSLGSLNLSAGQHTIKFEVVGKSNQSDNYYFGLDALKLDSGNPPQVTKQLDAELLQGTGAIGAKVNRNNAGVLYDSAIFRTNGGSYAIDGIVGDADQAVVTRTSRNSPGDIAGYSMTRGTLLAADGRTLLEALQSFNASVQIDTTAQTLTATIETADEITVFLFSEYASLVKVNGILLGENGYSYNSESRLLSITLPAGTHTVEISEI